MADLGAFAGLAHAAYVESMAAAFIIPAAWPTVAIMYEGQSDPKAIMDAADGWKANIDQLQQAQNKIDELKGRLSDQVWEGDDRAEFENKAHDYVNQLDFAIALAWVVVAVLYTLAILIAIFIGLMFVIATLLAIFAAAIALAAGTIFGAPAALEMEAEATAFCEGCQTVLEISGDVIQYTCWAAGGVLTVMLGVDVGGQMFKGNSHALANLGQATVNGLDDMAKGTLQYLEQRLTGKVIAGGAEIPRIPGVNRIPGLAAGTVHEIPEALQPFFRTVFGAKGGIDVGRISVAAVLRGLTGPEPTYKHVFS
jgi:hypothetical protein